MRPSVADVLIRKKYTDSIMVIFTKRDATLFDLLGDVVQYSSSRVRVVRFPPIEIEFLGIEAYVERCKFAMGRNVNLPSFII